MTSTLTRRPPDDASKIDFFRCALAACRPKKYSQSCLRDLILTQFNNTLDDRLICIALDTGYLNFVKFWFSTKSSHVVSCTKAQIVEHYIDKGDANMLQKLTHHLSAQVTLDMIIRRDVQSPDIKQLVVPSATEGQRVLLQAIKDQDSTAVTMLLAAFPNCTQPTQEHGLGYPLMLAVVLEVNDIVEVLFDHLEKHSDPQAWSEFLPFLYRHACAIRHIQCMELIRDRYPQFQRAIFSV